MLHSTKDENDLKRILNDLDKETKDSQISDLTVDLKRFYADGDILLWQVLSHTHSKITRVSLKEPFKDALVDSRAMKHVRRWCENVPAVSPRSIHIYLQPGSENRYQDVLMDLQAALLHPNSNVQWLDIDCGSPYFKLCELLFQPVLQSPDNRLTSLSFQIEKGIHESEARALSLGLASPHCKLELFETKALRLTFTTARILLEGLGAMGHLKQLKWWTYMWKLTGSEENSLITQLSGLLTRQGNVLRSLKLTTTTWEQRQFSILAKALNSEHCQLDKLRIIFSCIGENSLVNVIANMSFRLRLTSMMPISKSLIMEFYGMQGNHGVESLELITCHRRLALEILHALEEGGLPHAKRLNVRRQPLTVLWALTASLRSVHCNIRSLNLKEGEEMDPITRGEFYRALRTSCVLYVENQWRYPFCEAFNAPFLQVLYTLLSITCFPRLTRYIWLRSVPFSNFILKIAETLAWPLDDLRIDPIKGCTADAPSYRYFRGYYFRNSSSTEDDEE